MVKLFISLGVLTAMGMLAGAVRADGTSADAVLEYVPGTISSASLQKSGAAAIGLPASVDDGQTSPFSPPFHATAITIIGAGGDIVLHFAQPVLPTVGPDIGIFTNTGLVATSSGGVITAATASDGTAATLGMKDAAIVSVSVDDSTWVPLNGGNALDLTMPSNAFLNGTFAGGTVSGGTLAANPFQPFAGTLTSFARLTYPQMVGVLNGSFGGAWIDASTSGLPVINYIRFDVPTGDRLVLDAVTAASAVPEPGTLATLAIAAGALLTRRNKNRIARANANFSHQDSMEPQVGNPTVHSFLRESHSMKTISAIIFSSMLIGVTSNTANALQISDSFATNPLTDPNVRITGDDAANSSSRFTYNAANQTLTAHYNTTDPSIKLALPLGQHLLPTDSFQFSATFSISSTNASIPTDFGGQIASFGLFNSQTTGNLRASTDAADGNAYDLLTFDYFPETSDDFGGNSADLTAISSPSADPVFDDHFSTSFFNSTSLPANQFVTVTGGYDASTNNVFFALNGATLATGTLTTPFDFDSLGLTLWNDPFIGQGDDPVIADVTFSNIALNVTAAPEPVSLAILTLGAPMLIKRRTRRGTV